MSLHRHKTLKKETNVKLNGTDVTYRHRNTRKARSTWEPVPVSRVQIVGQVDGDQHSAGRRVDGHIVGSIVQELSAGVTLNIV